MDAEIIVSAETIRAVGDPIRPKPRMLRLISSRDGGPIRNRSQPGRNSCCPCGSGKKYKNCHMEMIRNHVSIGLGQAARGELNDGPEL